MGQALDVFRRRAQKVQAVAVDVVRVAEDVADVARDAAEAAASIERLDPIAALKASEALVQDAKSLDADVEASLRVAENSLISR
jgi:hypothetical protein